MVKMPTNDFTVEFHQFARLPIELRLMIWEFCLPSRVIEMDTPSNLAVEVECELHFTTFPLRSPPLIARVCRESRRVALRNGFPIADLYKTPELQEEGRADHSGPGRKDFFGWVNESEAWVQPGRDHLHLHWSIGGYDGTFYHTPQGNPLVEFAALAKHGRLTGVSISDELIFNFERSQDKGMRWAWSSAPRAEHIPLIERGREYCVVIKILSIHVSFQAGCQSGLFGLLGDAPIQLVDPFYVEKILAFRDFFLASGKPDPDEDTWIAFEKILEFPSFPHSPGDDEMDEPFAVKVTNWQKEIKDNWILHKAGAERRNGGDSPPSNSEIWTPINSGPIQDTSSNPPIPGAFGNPDFWSTHQLNHENPWVKEALEKMPTFRPVIMFRLCHGRCHVPHPTMPPPVRGRGGRFRSGVTRGSR